MPAQAHWCKHCKEYTNHTSLQHRAWQLTKRPRVTTSKPITNRDPQNLNTR